MDDKANALELKSNKILHRYKMYLPNKYLLITNGKTITFSIENWWPLTLTNHQN